MSSEPAVVLSDVTLHYGTDTEALDRTDLRIEQGDCVALVGPSGCGKSTILKFVAGLLEPSSGGVIVGGRQVSVIGKKGLPAPVTRIGLAFQNPTMLPWLSTR